MPPQTIAHYNGTLQWHHSLCPHHSTLQWHLAMAPRPLPKVGRHPPPTTIAHYNGNLQWHPTMAPRPIPQSWSSPSPHNDSTLQWQPAMAPNYGTTSTPPKLVVTLPPNYSTLQWHPIRWHSNGTTSSAPCNGTLVPRPVRQSGSSPSPRIGSKNPYSYRYLGKKSRTYPESHSASTASYPESHYVNQQQKFHKITKTILNLGLHGICLTSLSP